MIKIIVLGNPVSQLRPILSTQGKHKVTAIDPPKSRKYKELIKQTARKYVGWDWEPLDEPLKIDISFYREIPKSWSKKKQEQANNGELLPVSKPDVDNYLKCFLDGNTGVVWKDDNCIIEINTRKLYSKVPRAEMKVYTLDNGEWV